MTPKNMLKALPVAVAAALSLAPVGTANAAAYAYSYDEIFNLNITSIPPANAPAVTAFAANSSASATLTGTGGAATSDTDPAINPGGTSNFDAPPANLGTAVGTPNNTFAPLGPAGFYARGDAVIDTTQINPLNPSGPGTGNLTRARNVAEAFVSGAGNAGTGEAGNTSSTRITFSVAGGPTQLQFDFDADPLMRVSTTLAGESAVSTIQVGFSIFAEGGLIPVFAWAPDGAAGGAIAGGTENSDPFSLNAQLSQLVPGFSQYDPVVCAPPAVCPGAHFQAITNALAPGNYRLELSMTERVSVRSAAAVPEPGTLTLLGLALAGLGFTGYRRRKVTAD